MADTFMHPAQTSEERKRSPVWAGLHGHFPAACELVSRQSAFGNDKHNPGQPMQHDRSKSKDHADCMLRHQKDIGTIDPESGLDHAVAVAWRAMAQLQELAEAKYGWPVSPNATNVQGPTQLDEITQPPDLYRLDTNSQFLYEIVPHEPGTIKSGRVLIKERRLVDGTEVTPPWPPWPVSKRRLTLFEKKE